MRQLLSASHMVANFNVFHTISKVRLTHFKNSRDSELRCSKIKRHYLLCNSILLIIILNNWMIHCKNCWHILVYSSQNKRWPLSEEALMPLGLRVLNNSRSLIFKSKKNSFFFTLCTKNTGDTGTQTSWLRIYPLICIVLGKVDRELVYLKIRILDWPPK